jgi:hypothetical protein
MSERSKKNAVVLMTAADLVGITRQFVLLTIASYVKIIFIITITF